MPSLNPPGDDMGPFRYHLFGEALDRALAAAFLQFHIDARLTRIPARKQHRRASGERLSLIKPLHGVRQEPEGPVLIIVRCQPSIDMADDRLV